MSQMFGASTARVRLALALVVSGAVALLMPSLLATPMDAPSVALMAAVAVALAAVVGLNRLIATSVPRSLAAPPRTADQAPSFLAARVTDPLHHPLRPRAPGLV
jgi:hypothetical protein